MSVEQVDPAFVEALQKQIATLRDRVDQQDEEIAELKSRLDNDESSSSRTGGRDQAVIEQLDRGDVVSVSQLKELYRMYTDVRTERTLKNRVRSLTKRPDFEQVAHAKWTYTGGEGDD